MVNKKISDEKGEVEKKEIDKLIDFLERFKEDCEIKKGDIQTYVKGHIVWKEKKTIRRNTNVKKDKDKDSDEMKEDDVDFIYLSTEFEFSPDSFKDLANANISKLSSLRKLDERVFKINERLPHGSYGYISNLDPNNLDTNLLTSYLSSLTETFTSNYKEGLIQKKEGGKEGRKIKDGTSLAITFMRNEEKATFINLINLKNALTKSRAKIILNLDKKFKAMKISPDSLIMESDVFNCVVFGDELFVFNSSHFFYMFMPTKVLLKEIETRKSEMDETLVNKEHVISYAEKNAAHARDLYYFLAKGSKIPEKDEIEKDLKIMKEAGVDGDIFTLNENNMIICSKENAGLVLAYISKKLGLRISDKRLVNVESATNL